MPNVRKRFRRLVLGSTAAAIAAVAAVPAGAIVARDDVGIDGAAAAATDPMFDPVVQIFVIDKTTGSIFFNCTGTLISPRQVLTAAHCLNDVSSEAWGDLASSSDLTVIVTAGNDTQSRLFSFADTLAPHSQGGAAQGIDVVIHPNGNIDSGADALPFPFADVALITLGEAITDFPTMGMLLSPLTGETHVRQVGFGSFGTGSTGASSIGFIKRAGENTLGMSGSIRDLFIGIFGGDFDPVNTQTLYFMDFDNPADVDPPCTRATPAPGSVSCPDLDAILDFNPFNEDDALPGEVGTAGGDSGSPLIADQLADFPVILGVLSGGFSVFEPPRPPNGYGDISFYNPLFLFHEFLVENMATKYVSALPGDGLWTDPSHWVQNLDPNFFIIDGNGDVVNGVPTGPEPGVDETGPKFGTVFGFDISGNPAEPFPGLPGVESAGGSGPVQFAAPMDTGLKISHGDAGWSPLPASSSTGETVSGEGEAGPAPRSLTQTPDDVGVEPEDFPIPDASPLLGPGSTNFVPDNTNGAIGTAFENPAMFFNVTLSATGTTTLTGASVEIDALNVTGSGAGLDIASDGLLSVIIGTTQTAGTVNVDGILASEFYNQMGGGTAVGEDGVLFVVADYVNSGGLLDVSGLADVGAFTQLGGLTHIRDTGVMFDFFGVSLQTGGAVLVDGIWDTLLYGLDGGALGGNGTISAPFGLVNSGGVVSPGASVGTLTVLGDYEQGPAGTFLAEADSTGNDELIVQGNAILDGALVFNQINGYLAQYGDEYDIIFADSVTGNFATVADNFVGVLFATSVVDNTAGGLVTVLIDAEPFTDYTTPGSDSDAVGGALDDIRATDYESLSGVFETVDHVPLGDLDNVLGLLGPQAALYEEPAAIQHLSAFAGQIRNRGNALRRGATGFSAHNFVLSQDQIASAEPSADILMAAADAHEGAMAPRHYAMPRNWGGFIAGQAAFGDADGLIGTPGQDLTAANITLGFDYRVSEGTVAGIAGNYGHFTVDANDFTPFANDTFAIAAFLASYSDPWYFDIFAGYADQSYELQRIVPFGPLTAEAETGGSQFLAGGEIGVLFEDAIVTGLTVNPRLTWQYADLTVDAYTESGAGPFGLTVQEHEIRSGLIGVGAEISHSWRLDSGGFIVPAVHAEWMNDLSNKDEVTAVFTAAPFAPFTLTRSRDAGWWRLGAGLNAVFSERFTGYVSYDAEVGRDDLDIHRVTAGLRVNY